jgi:hypothetical protein
MDMSPTISLAHRVRPIWIVVCILMGKACLYTAPMELADPNEGPVIVIPPTNQNELIMESNPEYLQVTAFDPNGDNLYFTWTVPHGVTHTVSPITQDDDLTTSVLSVDRDTLLDQETILCAVSDLQSGNTVMVSWYLEVP